MNRVLAIAGLAYAFHVLLFPNPDTRYAIVPCLMVGVQAILSFQSHNAESPYSQAYGMRGK